MTSAPSYPPLAGLPPRKVMLVIPCFNDAQRLGLFLPELCATLKEKTELGCVEAQLQVVNDGSTAAEAVALDTLVTPLQEAYPFLKATLHLPQNRGKGGLSSLAGTLRPQIKRP